MSTALLWQLLRTEGARAVRDRLLDRWQERQRQASFAPLQRGVDVGVLNVLATAPAPRLGGMQVQLMARLEEQAAVRPCALLHADAGGYWLEIRDRERSLARALPDHGFVATVRAAAQWAGARVVHLEGLAGVPLGEALALASEGLRLVISVHDFAAFCPRPHLLAVPELTFCNYCRDLDRCFACLRHDFPVERDFQARHRASGAALLRTAHAVVFPSEFLRDAWRALVPDLDAARLHVIPPACAVSHSVGAGTRRPGVVAYVGAVNPQKGAAVFEELVRSGPREVRWEVYGKGEQEWLRRLRALPSVHVRGYYRSGALPALLVRRGVELALALSITPEAYGLAVDECLAAGVPVIAFDHGAVAERLRRLDAGALVPLADGWQGVASTIDAHRAGRRPLRVPEALQLPDAHGAARSHAALYDSLLEPNA